MAQAQTYDAERFHEKRLDIDGFMYVFSFDRKASTYWDCSKVRNKECKARAVTSVNHMNQLVVVKGPNESEHSHPPNRDAVEAEKIRLNIKKKAQDNPQTRPASVIRGLASVWQFDFFFF